MGSPGHIFIGGSGRCGTTLLRDLVIAHPRVWGVDKESHMFAPPQPNLVDLYVAARDGRLDRTKIKAVTGALREYFSRGYADHIVKRIGHERYYEAFARLGRTATGWVGKPSPEAGAVISRWARELSWPGRKKGATHFCEKSPWNVVSFCELAELYPNASLVHIIRDPRDTIDSLSQQRWTRNAGYRGVAGCIRWYELWLDSYERSLSHGLRGLRGYYELRYEALVRYPRQWIELWRHVGLPAPKPPKLKPVHEGRWHRWSERERNMFRGLAIRRPRVDEWVAETRRITGAR